MGVVACAVLLRCVVVFVNCVWCVVALLCGLLLDLLVRGLLLIVLLCACCLVCCMFMGIW